MDTNKIIPLRALLPAATERSQPKRASEHLFEAMPYEFNRDPAVLVYDCPVCGQTMQPKHFFNGWHRRQCRCEWMQRERDEIAAIREQIQRTIAQSACDKTYTWLAGMNDDLDRKTFDGFYPERQVDQVDAFVQAKDKAMLFAERVIQIEKGYVERRGINAVLLGSVGVGKTHLAASILNACRASGVAGRFCTAQDFFDAIYARIGRRMHYDDLLRDASETPLWLLDELDKLHLPTSTDGKFQRDTLFAVLDKRYKRKLPTLVTMNTFTVHPYIDEATESRLSIGLMLIEMDGQDYRKTYLQNWM